MTSPTDVGPLLVDGVGKAVAALHDTDQIETVMRYHERTKHRFDRYASGPGELGCTGKPG